MSDCASGHTRATPLPLSPDFASSGAEVEASLNGHRIVNRSIVVLRRFALATLCAVAALLAPTLAQADSLRADLDGDGIRDRIELGRGSRELAVRLSATRRWQRLQNRDLIVRFVVVDVD